MSRAERMAELRQWAALIKREPKWVRVQMNAEKYAHWADVNFLLDELDTVLDETKTPATAMEPIRVEPTRSVNPKMVDPADFTETIAVEPNLFGKLTKKHNVVDSRPHHVIDSAHQPTLPTPPKIPDVPTQLPPIKVEDVLSKQASILTEADVWNAAVAKAQAAIERTLSDAIIKRSDIYAIKAALAKSVAECRKPLDWDEGYKA